MVGKSLLIVTTEFPPSLAGGLGTYSYEVARALSKLSGRIIVLAPGIRAKNYPQENFKVIRYPSIFIIREISLVFYIFYAVARYRMNIIFAIPWYPCGIASLFIKIFLRIPYIVKTFGSDIVLRDISKSGIQHRIKQNLRWLKKRVFKHAEYILPNSHFTEKLLKEQGVSQDKIKVVFPGIDINKFSPLRGYSQIISRYGLQGKKIILTVGRLQDYKGQDNVIKSLPGVIEEVKDIVYVMVGKGEYEENIKGLIKQLNLQGRVIFIERIDAGGLVKLYSACDIFILASREIPGRVEVEGFGIVFLEASACAKPVIGGRSGGITDAVIDGKTGLLVDPLNIGEISEAIIKLLKDPDYARRLGQAGRLRCEKDFTWDKSAGMIWDAIQQIK